MRDYAKRLDRLQRIWPTTPACPGCEPTARVLLVGGNTPPESGQRCPACRRPWRMVVFIGVVDIDRI
ncbi:MAG: hypothetical protein M3Q03_21295 [Chloroflexota bacterium]|nr:hypothetical protein [Chloroflexota bacterium]